MDPAADHTVKEVEVHAEESGYGAIVAGAIALVFLAFVVHAATLPTQQPEASAPAAAAPQGRALAPSPFQAASSMPATPLHCRPLA